MSKVKIIILVSGIIFLGIVAFLGYMGIFSTHAAVERTTGPYTFAYEDFTGPYKDTGPVFDRVYKALEKEGIKTTRGLGIYFDDPREVPAEKLKSQCGSVIEKKDLGRVPGLEKKFKIKKIEKHDSIVVEFPIKNSLSYMIGPMKCYPVLMEYAREKGVKTGIPFELYEMPENKILFIMEIVR